MKIAFVVPGGFERPDRLGPRRELPVWNALVTRLSADHDVHVFCTDFDHIGGDWSANGAEVHDPGKVPARSVPALRTLERIGRTCRRIARENRRGKFDLVHAAWVDANGFAATLSARALDVPSIATVGGGECIWLPEIRYGNAGTRTGRAMTRFTLRSARLAIANSHAARLSLAETTSRAIEVVPLGPERDTFFQATDRASGPPWRLINVADLNPVKDHSTLLLALRVLKLRGLDVSLDQYGFDARDGWTQRLASQLELDACVRFHGRAPQTVLAKGFRESHLHVISSRFESQCVAVAEAALAGTPNVGSHVGLMADLAPWGAVTVPPAEPMTLANAIEDTLMDASKRFAIAKAAQEWACRNDAEACARRYSELYARVSGANANFDSNIVPNT